MMGVLGRNVAEVRILRHGDSPECEVVVVVCGREMVVKCPSYHRAVQWARLECKSYKIAEGFSVEWANGYVGQLPDQRRRGLRVVK
jgi:hypothetical protein